MVDAERIKSVEGLSDEEVVSAEGEVAAASEKEDVA